ncbi:MAG: hypothetical protein ACO2PP_26255 [Thermocrinis sp.]
MPQRDGREVKKICTPIYCYYSTTTSPFAVDMFYRDFRQVEDEEVQNLLQ